MTREPVERFGVSISQRLLRRFDKVLREKGYGNRSEAIRDLIRDYLVEEEWRGSKAEVVGCVVLVYDHHVHGISERLTETQHQYKNIISSMHVHLDEENCLEVLVIRGVADEVKRITDALISARGVKHGKLVMTGKVD